MAEQAQWRLMKAQLGQLKTEKNNTMQAVNSLMVKRERLAPIVHELKVEEERLSMEITDLRAEREQLLGQLGQLRQEHGSQQALVAELERLREGPVNCKTEQVEKETPTTQGMQALARAERRLQLRLVRLTSEAARAKREADEHAAALAILKELVKAEVANCTVDLDQVTTSSGSS